MLQHPVNTSDETGAWPSWAKKVAAAVAVVAVVAIVAAITVATAGAGTAAAVIESALQQERLSEWFQAQ